MPEINLSPVQFTLQLFPVGGSPLNFTMAAGLRGAQGTAGEDGAGVPDGGDARKILAKATNQDQDTEWIDHVVDEDDFASESAIFPPSQQSAKAYVASQILDEDAFTSDSATKAPSQQSTAAYIASRVLDEDDFATDSATRPPSQQSTKAYVDAAIAPVAFLNFETAADYEAASVGDDATYFRLAGYAEAGDGGGALYKIVASEPSHPGKLESADGKWGEIVDASITPETLGADATDAGDTQAISDAFDVISGRGYGELSLLRLYNTNATLTYDGTTGITIRGVDANTGFKSQHTGDILIIGSKASLGGSQTVNNKLENFRLAQNVGSSTGSGVVIFNALRTHITGVHAVSMKYCVSAGEDGESSDVQEIYIDKCSLSPVSGRSCLRLLSGSIESMTKHQIEWQRLIECPRCYPRWRVVELGWICRHPQH